MRASVVIDSHDRLLRAASGVVVHGNQGAVFGREARDRAGWHPGISTEVLMANAAMTVARSGR